MNLLLKLARIPFLLWLAIGAGLAYQDYSNWKDTVLQPLEGEKESKTSQLAGLKKEANRAEEFRRRKEEKLRELQAVTAKLEGTRQRYPTSPNIPQLLKDLADTADRTGLEFSTFKPQAERKQDFIVITPIEVKLRGTYVQIMSFLDTSANLKRAVVAEHLALDQPTSREGSVSVLNASANLVTYSVDEAATSMQGGASTAGAAGQAAPGSGGKGP